MCFISRLTLSATELKKRFQVELDEKEKYIPSQEFNGFLHPKTPVIASNRPSNIQLFSWGLLPSWAKDVSFQKNTLNARMETLSQKPSFKPYLQNRCLILADGFYEWQWLDAQGKNKLKYLITLEDEQAFAFAGLWNGWRNQETGDILNTYTILTQPATGLMAEIHNSKLRMPFILSREQERAWLEGEDVASLDRPLKAQALGYKPNTLFD